MRKLGWQQRAELQDLQGRLQLQFQAEMTRLQEEHSAQLLRIRCQHREQVSALRGQGVRVEGAGEQRSVSRGSWQWVSSSPTAFLSSVTSFLPSSPSGLPLLVLPGRLPLLPQSSP